MKALAITVSMFLVFCGALFAIAWFTQNDWGNSAAAQPGADEPSLVLIAPTSRPVPHCASPELMNAARDVLVGIDRYATMHQASLIEAEDMPLRRVCRALVFVGAGENGKRWMRYTVERAGSQWFVRFSDI